MEKLELPGYEFQNNEYTEKISQFQKYGNVLFGIIILSLALLTLIFNYSKGSGTIIFTAILAIFGFMFLYLGYINTIKIFDISNKKLVYKSVFGNKIIKEFPFSEFNDIKAVDFSKNGVYEGRYFYFILNDLKEQHPGMKQKLNRPIKNSYDYQVFETNIRQIIFNS